MRRIAMRRGVAICECMSRDSPNEEAPPRIAMYCEPSLTHTHTHRQRVMTEQYPTS